MVYYKSDLCFDSLGELLLTMVAMATFLLSWRSSFSLATWDTCCGPLGLIHWFTRLRLTGVCVMGHHLPIITQLDILLSCLVPNDSMFLPSPYLPIISEEHSVVSLGPCTSGQDTTGRGGYHV